MRPLAIGLAALALTPAVQAGAMVAGTTAAHAAAPCGQEDGPRWDWARCGDHRRGVVTMWGTPKVVTCGDLRWLVRHGDLDERSPRLRGDARCGR